MNYKSKSSLVIILVIILLVFNWFGYKELEFSEDIMLAKIYVKMIEKLSIDNSEAIVHFKAIKESIKKHFENKKHNINKKMESYGGKIDILVQYVNYIIKQQKI